MKKLVVNKKKEIASMNILEELDEICPTLMCESDILELSEIRNLKNTLVIVASPHSSKAGVLSLSIHANGNFGKAEFGGENRTLGVAPAIYLGEGFRKMNELSKNLPHKVTLEATHHGPTYPFPMIWVEIGSSMEGWKDKGAASIAARTIEYLLDLEPDGESSIGIGGPHYTPNFNKLTLRGENFGHICPKYAINDLDKEMLLQMIEKTTPTPKRLVLDWKGIPGGKRQEIEKIAKEYISVEKV